MEMNMQKVNLDDLLYEDDTTYSLDGVPFSGIACEYFPNGRVRSEIQFVNGHQEGIARDWYENGQMRSEAEYLGDGHHGLSKEWHPNGQLRKQSVCKFGICL